MTTHARFLRTVLMIGLVLVPSFSLGDGLDLGDEGSDTTGGVIGAVVAVIFGVGAVAEFSTGSRLHDAATSESSTTLTVYYHWHDKNNGLYYSDLGKALMDEGDKDFTVGGWYTAGAVGSALLSALWFNDAADHRKHAMIDVHGQAIALSIPTITLDPLHKTVLAPIVMF